MEPTLTHTVGRRLRATRTLAGLSQGRLAGRLKTELGITRLTQSEIGRIERGQRSPGIEDLCALAAALHVSPLHLLVPPSGGVTLFGDVELDRADWRDWLCGMPPPDPFAIRDQMPAGQTDDGRPAVDVHPDDEDRERVYVQASVEHPDGLLPRWAPPGVPDSQGLVHMVEQLVARVSELEAQLDDQDRGANDQA